jgi:peptidoglycan/xylan/chitin deacetylase (PgdA/CDA1 family)
LLAPRFAGLGAIFTLHRVVPAGQPYLYPGYEAPADFLDRTLAYVLNQGWEAVSIDEAARRLESGGNGRRFVCFTLDDGYADNYSLARPIFQRHGVPFCVYIATGILNRTVFYWWGGLEELILRNDEVTAPVPGGTRRFQTRTLAEKRAAYDALDELCHLHNDAYFPVLAEMFRHYGVDAGRALDRDAMTVAQARELARDPLATVGAHGVTHKRLCLMSGDELRAELESSRRELEKTLGAPVDHMAYPFGNRDACGVREFEAARAAGYRTAVTTRRGNLFEEHRKHLHCLPRRGFPTAHADFRRRLYGVESILRNEPTFVLE